MSTSDWEEFVEKVGESHKKRDYPLELMNWLKEKNYYP